MYSNTITPIISNGHGGMIAGKYQTKGKRSPKWPNGKQLFEGEFNRAVVARLRELLQLAGIPYYQLVPENKDITLGTRVRRANNFYKSELEEGQGMPFLIEVHANAAPEESAGIAHGAEVHISPNASRQSHYLAEITETTFKKHFPNERWRGTKIKKFDIIHKTKMPAILVECFYMDNERECNKFLLSQNGRDRIAQWIFEIITNYIKRV